jgi:tetratricopeptide (TPR) repeat protein
LTTTEALRSRSIVKSMSIVLLALAVMFSGCDCGKRTDEEILRERIDITKVHLYLATKIAILKADQSDDAKAARDALLRALKALKGQPTGETSESGPPTRELTASDVLELAKALYKLKAEGKELLESGDEKGMTPILPMLFDAPPEMAQLLNLNMEHALLLTGMFMLKLHPSAPTPIPPELMLYEASMTDSDKLLPGMRSFVQMEKAFIYGTNELCDLAAKEAAGAEKDKAQLVELIAVMKAAGAAPPDDISEKQIQEMNAGVRALAHGVTAYCYQQRDEGEKAIESLDATLQALEDSGVAAGETALLRAYVAMERGEQGEARKHLETARDWKGTDPETKKDIEAILDKLGDDPNVFEEQLGKAFFTAYLAKIILRHLDKMGVFDELKETELVKTINNYVGAISQTMNKAKDAIPGKGWVDDVKGLVSDD